MGMAKPFGCLNAMEEYIVALKLVFWAFIIVLVPAGIAVVWQRFPIKTGGREFFSTILVLAGIVGIIHSGFMTTTIPGSTGPPIHNMGLIADKIIHMMLSCTTLILGFIVGKNSKS